jgi:uncharacterized membrane protein YeaQ/YmgE (transglycosylase-associated protein family)
MSGQAGPEPELIDDKWLASVEAWVELRFSSQSTTGFSKQGGQDMPNWLWWIIIGIAAGWIAGQVMKGSGYGLLGDLIIGAIGGLIGGYVFGLLKIPSSGIWGALITAVVGAILLIAVVRAIRGGRR